MKDIGIDDLEKIEDIEIFLKENPNILLYRVMLDVNDIKNSEWTNYKQIIRAEKLKKLSDRIPRGK